MDSNKIEERLKKLREERNAREKARIEKLRELNLKKYNNNEPHSTVQKNSTPRVTVARMSIKSDTINNSIKQNPSKTVKNNFHVNGTTKRPISVPLPPKTQTDAKTTVKSLPNKDKNITDKTKASHMNDNLTKTKTKNNITSTSATIFKKPNTTASTRKSIQPPQIQTNNQNSRQSVFERLYKPKIVPKEIVSNVTKFKTDPDYQKRVIKNANLILNNADCVLNKRHTTFDSRKSISQANKPVRRSISAVHFKRINKSELSNCIHKWASIGEKLNNVNIKDVHEDEGVKENLVVSTVKSERKRVKFQTPVPLNLNTPKPEELQRRLQNWLQKRGKSLDSFHHLQCFGLHHLPKEIKPLNIEAPKFDLYDDENKENVPLESDSDNESYTENINEQKDDLVTDNKVNFNKDKWRRASYINDSVTDTNESTDTITSSEVMHHVDELLLGALNDLTELLREGFDWEQCARWLRAIRDKFPSAPDNAAYWECRAALEETRGNLPASVQCWEEAIAKGTEHSVVEANLDQLLDKFLQLRISPSSGRRRADPKMVDVKNVFKSTIIRFAVQQAKLRQSNQHEQAIPKFTVTPVRRSGRLSMHCRTQTPLRICTSVKQAYELGPAEFRPNRTLTGSP